MTNISSVFKSVLLNKYSSIQDTNVDYGNTDITADYSVEDMDLSLTSSTSDNTSIFDANIADLTSSKETFVKLHDLTTKELENIDSIINKANQENNLVNRYNGYSSQSKGGYGPTMQAAQGELSRVQEDLDNFIKANSTYSSYQELLGTQKQIGDIDKYCEEVISYYDRQIKWQEYYKIYNSEECQKSSIEGMLGEKEYHDNISGNTFRGEEYTKLLEIRTIGNYDDKLKELFGDDYQEQFASYGLDFQFDYLKMYNYLYQTQGEEAAKEFYAFAEDNINSMDGLVHALCAVNQLTTNAEIMEAATNYLTVNAQGMGDGVVGSLEGVVAWFSDNRSRSANSYETMWYSMMLETGKYGKGQVFNYQVGQGTGQMLPVMLIGLVCPESLMIGGIPVVKIATSGYLLMSSGGRVYKEQMINGKSRKEAILYGLLSGATEVTTEHLLGGLPFLSETNVYNLKTYFTAMGKEGFQEVIQDLISEFLLGDGIPNFSSEAERDAYWDQWAKEKLMTFAVAAFSAGELQGGNLAMSKINISNINTQIDKGIVTEQELVDLIKEQYPTETMDLSNEEIIGEYNRQITKYIELKLEAILKMSSETSSASTEETTSTINNPIDMHSSLDIAVNNKQIHIDENGVMTDLDGNVVGTSNNNPIVQEVLKKYDGSFDSKTRATSFKTITLDDGNSYGILRNGRLLNIEDFNNRAGIINKLSASGVNTPQLISCFTDGNYTYQIQALASGKELFGDSGNMYQSFLSRSSQLEQLASLDADAYLKYIEDFCTIRDNGLDFDPHIGNMLFDGDTISFIDLSANNDGQSNEAKISQVYNHLVRQVKNDYDYYAAYGLEEYLPPVDEQIERFEMVKEKMINAYVEYMTLQGYDEQIINEKLKTFNESENGMISSFQVDTSLEKTIQSAFNKELRIIESGDISLIKDIANDMCVENGTTIPDIDSLIGVLNENDITIYDKTLTKDDIIIVPLGDSFDIELSEDFISKISDDVAAKVDEEAQLRFKELEMVATNSNNFLAGNGKTNIIDNINTTIQSFKHDIQVFNLSRKYQSLDFVDLTVLAPTVIETSSPIEVEAFMDALLKKSKNMSYFQKKLGIMSYFDKLEMEFDNVINKRVNSNLSDEEASKYLGQIVESKKPYVLKANENFLANVKKSGIDFKLDSARHPIFLNLQPNCVYELKYSINGTQYSIIVHTNSYGEGYSLFDKGYSLYHDNQFVDFNILYKDQVSIDSFEVNDEMSKTIFDPNSRCFSILNNGSILGINQGALHDDYALESFCKQKEAYLSDTIRLESKEQLDFFSQEVSVVKKYFPDLNPNTIIQYLSKIDSTGACTYASSLNLMIMEMFTNPELSKLIGNVANFRKVFGYDLYRLLPDGSYTINQELLLADFYTFVNKDNTDFFQVESDGSTTFLNPDTYENQIYVSNGFLDSDLIEKFLNYKLTEAGLNYQVSMQSDLVISNNSLFKPSFLLSQSSPSFETDFYNALQKRLDNGENLAIDVSHTLSSNPYQMYEYDPKTGVHNYLYTSVTINHAMTITQAALDGIYVQSWAGSFFIPYSTLKDCEFYVNNLITNVSEVKE